MKITAEQLREAEDRWIQLRDSGDSGAAAAYEEYQRLARTQTQQLQTLAMQNLVSRMLK